MKARFAIALLALCVVPAAYGDAYRLQAERLRSPKASERQAAVLALRKTRDYRALEDFTALLRREKHPTVRRLAVETLVAYCAPLNRGQHGEPFLDLGDIFPLVQVGQTAVDDLCASLDGPYALAAALALGEIGDRRAIPALDKSLDRAKRYQIFYSGDALRKLQAPGLVDHLIPFFGHEPSSDAYGYASWVTEKMMEPRWIPQLVAAYERVSPAARRDILPGLAKCETPSTVAFLEEALKNDPDASKVILRLRFRQTDPATRRIFTQALDHPDPALRSLAQAYWRARPIPAMEGTFLKQLENDPEGERVAVIEALGRLKSELARPRLEQLLTNGSPYERATVAEALGEIGNPRSFPLLLRLLEGPVIHQYAVQSIGKFGAPAVAPLLKVSHCPDASTRRDVANVLGDMKAKTALPRLIQLLKDPDDDVQTSAIKALGKTGSPAALPALLPHFAAHRRLVAEALIAFGPRSTPELLRLAKQPELSPVAMWALGRLEAKSAIPLLIRKLREGSLEERGAAIEALGRIRDRRALPYLGALAHDPDLWIRMISRDAVIAILWPRAGVDFE